jgi:hypothetical protein
MRQQRPFHIAQRDNQTLSNAASDPSMTLKRFIAMNI